MSHPLYRPEPVPSAGAAVVDGSSDGAAVAAALRDGDVAIVADAYGTGADILAALERLMPSPGPGAPYAARQSAQKALRAASLRLLAPIEDHQVALADARPIGFLSELYPDRGRFCLPFPEVQALHGAWGRYRSGTHLAVLGHKVHPFYGTYVPTRTSHLELFGTWLSAYAGPKRRAMDVGTGCGVLAMMLARAGFGQVVATDCNPNAIESVRRDLARLPESRPMELLTGDLICGWSEPCDLIVFNPPWIQGEVREPLDHALHFEPGLFERFFEQALGALSPDGHIVLLFSTVLQLVRPDVPHPILEELERGRFELIEKMQRKIRPPRNQRGGRRRTREKVEVWVLGRAGAVSI